MTLLAEVLTIYSQDIPISGEEVVSLKSFDEGMVSFMKKWSVPGGQLAVCKDGRLVYSRGFGYGNLNNTEPVTTTNLFRIASVSKSITGVAIMKLIEDKKLSLDDKAFVILNDLTPPPGKTSDPRLYDITVNMLLEHVGGWTIDAGDRQINFLRAGADAFGLPRPSDQKTIIRYAIGDTLDFTPGTKYAYSNFGYNILGRIIEKVSGKSYEKYVQEEILKIAGITDMQIARTRLEGRLPNEVMYKGFPEMEPVWSVLDSDLFQVTFPYGGDFYIEVMDAHGGWLSRAEDLVKFVTSVDTKTNRPHILKEETVELMLAEPMLKSLNPDEYYAKGWDYEPKTDTWRHAGALFGTSSFILRYGNGVTIALVFNYLPMKQLGEYFSDMKDSMLVSALKNVKSWPENDLWK